ncbi:DGQHR domain-containing protein DpdB [Rubinisphaera margarita]|uniref:DGQHR domain-containing protein DpdB n=1 Tax=Rubinisphaera margarita TaxID=2909586 RepID=UPI001EE8AB1E|nr:DGQHR domain-containing protein DpdB [Rubinisphaera margarita]MCG6157724.1 DGQHR domain-containing protein [Rubinisphaera margarita]
MARKASKGKQIERRALRIVQNEAHPLYVFTLTGDELLKVADISKISRDATGALIGYQRSGVKRHVQDIVDYLNQDGIIFPNSIILALSSRVKFRQSRGPSTSDGLAQAGVLEIPLPTNGGPKPAWIVDGQQRALALSKCNRPQLPIPVNAFVADNIEIQRDQFLRVNSSKPLPRGLITELLPEVTTTLPANLSAKKMPSAICDWLNLEKSSPFRGLIRRASTSDDAKQVAVITDNSVVKMIEESLSQPSGCLFPYRNIATGETDFDGITSLLVCYWTAVSEVFPDAWGRPPAKSRLMHGAGIRAMGRLMDRIMPFVVSGETGSVAQVKRELKLIAPVCRWTKGRWEEMDGLRWNEVQNVPRHIHMLSNVLIRAYLQARGNRHV